LMHFPAEFNVVKSGSLFKRGTLRKNWKKRVFFLSTNKLQYYDDLNDPVKGEIDLSKHVTLCIDPPCDDRISCWQFSIQAQNPAGEKKPEILFLAAASRVDLDSWLEAIR
jgi:hypothetical protein